MDNKKLSPNILELGKKNNKVKEWIDIYNQNGCTYEEALEGMITSLVMALEITAKMELQIAMNRKYQPGRFIGFDRMTII